MSDQQNREIAKRYVLGILSEEERDRLEGQYFSDDSAFEEVEIAEDDLIDQYVRGELTSADRSLFERALSASPRLNERIEFSRLLVDKTSGAAVSVPAPEVSRDSESRGWRWFFWSQKPVFAFAVLLLMVGGPAMVVGWLKLRQQSTSIAALEAELQQRYEALAREKAQAQTNNEQWTRRLQEQQAQLEAEQQALQKRLEESGRPSTFTAFLYLRPGALRSGGQRSEATLNRHNTTLNLQLELLETDYSRYQVVVLNPDQVRVFGPRTLTPRKTRSGSFLNVSLPTKDISPGDYFVRVEGLNPSEEAQRVGDYHFRLKPER